MKRKVPVRLLSFLLAGALTVTNVQMPVFAAEAAVGGEAVAEQVTGAGISEGQPDIETEEAGLPAEQSSDSVPGDTVTEDDADPGDFDAVLPESQVSGEAGEITASEDREMSAGENMDAETEKPEEDMDAEEEEEISEFGETANMADGEEETTPTYKVTQYPTKQIYLTSEYQFDKTGLQITEQPANKTVDISQVKVNGFDPNNPNPQTVRFSYNGNDVEGSFDVLVISVPKFDDVAYGATLSDDMFASYNTNGTWTWMEDSKRATQVGKLTYQARFTTGNYGFRDKVNVNVTVTCDLETQANVNVNVNIPSGGYTYDGKKKEPTVVVTIGGVTLPSINYTWKYENNINAGSEEDPDDKAPCVIVTGKDDYYYTGSIKKKFTIAKAKITFTAEDKKIYCGDDPKTFTYGYVASGLVSKDHLAVEPKFAPVNVTNTDSPGQYYIEKSSEATIKDEVKDNYDLEGITYNRGTLTIEDFESQSVKVVGVIAADKEYDKKEWKYTGSIKIQDVKTNNAIIGVTVKPTYSGTLLKDGSEYATPSKAPTEAGSYTLTFTLDPPTEIINGVPREKYALEENSASYDFKITQKKVTVTAKPFTVEAGEEVPDIEESWHDENGAALPDRYTISGILTGDKQDDIIDTSKLKLKYSEDGISPDKAGEFWIEPYDDPKDPAIIDKNKNYVLDPVPGKLTVKGKLKFEADFNYIKVKPMTYSSKKHSISGDATGMGNFEIRVTGETRDKTLEFIDNWEEKKDPEEGDESEEGKAEDAYKECNYKKKRTGVPAADIVDRYQEIAPTEVGVYTLEIYSEINKEKNVYDYDGKALLKVRFRINPLQKTETKLVGATGVANKIYDGGITDLSEAIRNAKVWTRQDDVDITKLIEDNGKLKFWIKGYTPEDSEGEEPEESPFKNRNYYLSNPKGTMPSDAGEYELVVRIEADESQNYVTNEWSIPFEIKKRPLTLTVNDMKIPVNADGVLPDPAEYTYTITDGIITDEDKKILSNDDFDWLKIGIEPLGIEDTSTTGSYDLVATSNIDDEDKRKGDNYEIDYVPGKLFVQSQLCGVKELNLTNNKNIPHGTTLEEIADKYLPKSVVIYLDKDKTIEDKATVEWKTDPKEIIGNYKVNSSVAQNFKMKGTVVLPDLVFVTEEDKKWLTVEVDISVREPDDGTQAMRPYADVRSGTVGAGTRVGLYTDEEGAEIYYTVEADNPSLSVISRRYTGPIEIQCTMTIRAVARIKGKLDSEELRLTYYYNKNYKPGGPDDPDDPNGPTVPDDDIPKDEDGKPLDIPKGMWVTDVAPYTYTGKAVTPQVRVYDYKTRLEENKDYTISYKNNVNAADKNDPRKAPSIIIKGKGNYEGTISKTFTITPKNINDVHEENGRKVFDVKMDDITVAFAENKAQKPEVAVSWNGKKLVNKKDYIFEAYPYTAVGTYPVTVTGNGNYTGERKISFTITQSLPASLFTVAKIADYNYTGQEIRPMVVVMYQKALVSQGLEYTLSYEDNVEIGTASVVIKGMGRFAGVKRVNFEIKAPAALNKADVELVFGSGTVYTGKAITPSEIKMAVQVNNNGAVSTRVLTKDDYKVTYQNNVKAGTATAVFEGIGAYSGTLKKTFKITPYNIQNMQPEQITVQSTYPYMKGGSTQKPVVQFDGKTLQEGTDYTLSYKNNTKVGNTAVVTIKGKGNFTGSAMRTYQVTVRDISNVTVAPADKVYKLKAGNYKTTVRVLDTNGKALTAGKDYDRNIVYTYAERTVFSADVVKNAGDPVSPFDMLPIGTKVRATVTAIGKNYQGTATGTFTIVQADVSKAKVTIPAMTYTGKAIEPKKSEIVVMLNGVPLQTTDYRIVGYSNNLNKGTAKLTIQGQGNYGGTKTVNFKIKGKSLFAQ